MSRITPPAANNKLLRGDKLGKGKDFLFLRLMALEQRYEARVFDQDPPCILKEEW